MREAEARERFAQARVARLATLAADGRPQLVPIVFALVGQTVYSLTDQKPKRSPHLARLRNVEQDPRVCLLADHYEENWSALWWVRAEGRGRVLGLSRAGEPALALAALAERHPQQQAAGAILAVDIERWSGWAASARSD